MLTWSIVVPRQLASRGARAFVMTRATRSRPIQARVQLYSTSPVVNGAATSLTFDQSPLGKNGTHLLDGLDTYTVPAADDGHPLAVYGIQSSTLSSSLKPILLLHGRTWSSVPVYHLLGGPAHHASGEESRSLMEALLSKGLQPYCKFDCLWILVFFYQTSD